MSAIDPKRTCAVPLTGLLSCEKATQSSRKIGCALLDETNDLGIHDRAAFDASSFLYNARVALRPVRAIHREQAHPTVADMDAADSVVFQFVSPARSSWRPLGNDWLAGMNESGRRV
jgi:hypothetical protein